MLTLLQLQEKREQKLSEARAALDEIKAETPAERVTELNTRHDNFMGEIDAIDADITRTARLVAAELIAEEATEARDRADRENRDARRPQIGDRDAANIQRQAPGEIDVNRLFARALGGFAGSFNEEEQRAFAGHMVGAPGDVEGRADQSTLTGAAGGFLVPETQLARLSETLLASGPMLDPNVVTLLPTATGEAMPWPTVDDTGEASALVAEGVASPVDGSQDITFGEANLVAYTYRSGVVKWSNKLLRDSNFSADSLMRRLMDARMLRGANLALTTGTGSSQPQGVVTGSSAGKTAASASAIVYDEIIDLEHSVDVAYRASAKARFMLHDLTLAAVRKLKDGNGAYIWVMGNVQQGVPGSLSGRPYSINNDMATITNSAKTILFGDFSRYVARQVGGFNVLALRERFAEFLQTGFIAWTEVDGVVEDTGAIKHLIQLA